MIIVAIDPGFAARGRGCAVAVLEDGTLKSVDFMRLEDAIRKPSTLRLAPRAGDVVWEIPQVDARTRSTTPAVVQLAAVGGTLAGMIAGANGCGVVAVTPHEWKGSTPKPVHHGRMWTGLTPPERALLGGARTEQAIARAKLAGARERWRKPGDAYYPSTWLTHNLLDAVGIGLWRVGVGRGEPT